MKQNLLFDTRRVAMIGMFSAAAMVLMLFELPVPFAPPFYKLDFSELPILIGSFALGPVAGVIMELVKIVLKLCIHGTATVFIGEMANFVIGCSFILPTSIIYTFRKTRKNAMMACMVGTLILTIFGTVLNAVWLLPAFSELYGLSMESILEMGMKVNPFVTEGSIVSFVVACVAPLNLIKGTGVSIIMLLVYNPLKPIIKSEQAFIR